MKCLIKKVSAFLLLLPTIAMAGWQVANPSTADPRTFFPSRQSTRHIVCSILRQLCIS